MKVVMVMSFLLTLVGEISPEGELFVHSGKAVTLFTNITVDRYQKEDRVVSLYINGITNQRLIAVWVMERIIAIKWLDDYYAEKTLMDANQNIWIYNVDKKDAGLYAIKYGIHTNLAGPEVKLTVLDELTEEEQVQWWMDDHPEFKKKYSSSSLSTPWVYHKLIAFIVMVFALLAYIVLQRAHHVAEVKAGKIEAERECENNQMLEEIERNFNSEAKVKKIFLVGFHSAGKSSLINSLACLILGKYIPIASVRQGVELSNTYAVHRYPCFGITEKHLQSSPNEKSARRIHPHLPYLTNFAGLTDENADEILSLLKMLGYHESKFKKAGLQMYLELHRSDDFYSNFYEGWKTDVIIFVHSVTTREVPYDLIEFLLDICPRKSFHHFDVDFYVVLTKMDKVESGEVTEESVDAFENAVANLFRDYGFKRYKVFKLTNWCDDVGFPNFTAYNQYGPDPQSVALKNQLLKLLHNISTPKAES